MNRLFQRSGWTGLALLVICAAALGAQGPSNGGFSVKVWGVDDGLPQSAVLALTQTRDGYLWVGTLDGLARFDGLRFTTFREANTPGLGSSRILKVFEDSRGDLWIGTEAAGIYLARQGRLISIDVGRGNREGRLMSAAEDRNGAIWLYTADGQLCRYYSNRVDVWNAGAGQASYCRAVITDSSGLTWVGTDRSLTAIGPVPPGPAVALPVVHEFRFDSPAGRLDALLASRRGGYWRLANGRVQRWEGADLKEDLGPYPWTDQVRVTSVCEDLAGNLVVGTHHPTGRHGEGVFWFGAGGGHSQLGEADLPQANVLSLATDREGCLWVGMNGRGLARVKKRSFELLPGSRDRTAQSIAEDAEGGIWIGYNEQRIEHLPLGNAAAEIRRYTNLQAQASTFLPAAFDWYVRSVLPDSTGQIWAGVLNWGLLRLTDGVFRQVPGPEPLRRDVAVVYEDRSGRLWAGGAGGLACLEKGSWKAVEGPWRGVRAIAQGADNTRWIGTEATGLFELRDRSTNTWTRTNGLPSDTITGLAADGQGVLWIGTSSGLARLERGKLMSYSGVLGPAADSVAYLLVESPESNPRLWIGTTAGLVRVSLEDLNAYAAGKIERVQTRTYGQPDGLPSPECTKDSQPAACRGRDGRLWFPTTRGVVTVTPDQLRPNTNPPPVRVEAVLVNDRSVLTNSLVPVPLVSVIVPPRQESIEIRYTSLNLAAPEKARFRYRIDQESDWTEVDADRRHVRYTRIPPGEYTFQVTACNEDGVWNPVPATLGITVLPPFWQTWWFVTISGLALLGAVVGSVHYVSTQRLQRQLSALRQKEALENERARIARDLHDQLGANLTQVALLGELAEADKTVPEEVEAHARQISQTARETTRALDEIVWTVNPSNDTLDGLVNYICKYAQDYLAMAGFKYRFEVPPGLPSTPITPELRHNVFLVAKEAINNVVKHSGASAAWLRVAIQPGRFGLELEDNGKGIAPADQEKGRSGLRNMRRRIEDLGGSFELRAGAGGGAVVSLAVPVEPPTRRDSGAGQT